MEKLAEFIVDRLPHGSGIDCKWQWQQQKNGALLFFNSFHCMNEYGYYDGFADFSVKIKPDNSILEFSIAFHGKISHRKNSKYMLRYYLEEAIYHHMREYIGDIKMNDLPVEKDW